MEKITDWALLWRQLVEVRLKKPTDPPESGRGNPDAWLGRARDFDRRAKQKQSGPDAIRDFVLSRIDRDATVLDIGAGTGRWTLLLAPRASRVTALDTSPSMLTILRENLSSQKATNVAVVEGRWPAVDLEPHDFSLCSHACYAAPDLPAYLDRMIAVTRRTCYLVLRAPSLDGPMAEAARHLWGHPHDSPNFAVAYNVLLQMGICANVIVGIHDWDPWTSPSLSAALEEVKDRLGLGTSTEHDDFLLDLLRRRLTERDGELAWPPATRSALIYWDV